MEYGENFGHALQYARSAVDQMALRKIPPTPDNFAVWFLYYSNKNPDLKRTIDQLLDNDAIFDDRQNREIFEKFFTVEDEVAQFSDASDRAERELERIIGHLEAAGIDAGEYGRTLETLSGDIGAIEKTNSLKAIIQTALSATRRMGERSKELEQQLSHAASEILLLQGSLSATHREARTDGLTGLANRKQLDQDLRRMADAAEQLGQDFCLLMLDIDHFKKFNDTHGHQTGDEVLKLVASTLTHCIGEVDLAARYGGEEFCVLLPGVPLTTAAEVGERIRNRIRSRKIVNRRTHQHLGKITVSVGVGKFAPGETVGHLIERADEALYAAKRAGRDRVVTQNSLAGGDAAAGG